MARYPRLMPTAPQLFTARVVCTQRLSPSFQRVRIAGPELAGFEWQGRDHWFRLFLPPADAELRLPAISGRSWYRSYLLIPDGTRPHCSNYTVAGFRRTPAGAELDIDVVLHFHDGQPGGAVAAWALTAAPGSAVGLLDQGVLFDPPADADSFVLGADETGLPAVRGILADLPEDARGVAVLEVPTAADVQQVRAPDGVQLRWLHRERSGEAAGRAALAELETIKPDPAGYAFIVGESGLATGGRRVLRRAGLAASRISFSGFWKA